MAENPDALDAPSDAERSRALIRLRDRYAADHLNIDEFSQALDVVLGARTQRELEGASPAPALPLATPNLSWRDAESLEAHLPSEETILWVGRPEASFQLTLRSALVGLAVVAFFALWESSAATGGAPAFFLLWGLVVFGSIAYQAYGRVAVQSRRTLYAVTTQHVARVLRRRSGDQVDTVLVRTIPSISVTASKNGRGTITFGSPAPRSATTRRSPFSNGTGDEAVRFLNVGKASGVARLIGTLQAHETDAAR